MTAAEAGGATDPPAARDLPSVSALYGRHRGEDVFVLGTGASVRVLDPRLFAGRTVVGLNQAWRNAPITYGITMRPELNVPELIGDAGHGGLAWVVKRDKFPPGALGRIPDAARRVFCFEGAAGGAGEIRSHDEPSELNRRLDWVRRPDPDRLYLWSSIAQSAMNLAANMGARAIFLVGCDNCALGENHHAHEQHTFWRGVDPQLRYRQYYEGNAEVRAALRERGVPVYAVTPFLKLDEPELDFERLCEELERPRAIRGEDISPRVSLREENRRVAKIVARTARANLRAIGRLLGAAR